jgi:CHASE2 domain-containing sensor protein
MIDGASIGGISSFASGIAILSHEFARQPALYVVLWGMLTPFIAHKPSRLLIVPLAVTGVWFLGAYAGYELFLHINAVSWLEPIADMAVFLFLGDILHHLHEEYRKRTKKGACCHTA